MSISLSITEAIALGGMLLAIGGFISALKVLMGEISGLKTEIKKEFQDVKESLGDLLATVARHDVKIEHLEEGNHKSNGQPDV